MYAVEFAQPKTLADAAAASCVDGRAAARRRSKPRRGDEIAAFAARHARLVERHSRSQGHSQGRRAHRHRRDDAARRSRVVGRRESRDARTCRVSPKASAIGRCATWARSAARSPTTIPRPIGRRPCSGPARRFAPTSARSPPTISSRACSKRRWRPTRSSPPSIFRSRSARLMRSFRNPASRFALVGVFVAQYANGDVRVAVTGAAPSVFRATAIENALKKSFTPDAAKGVERRREGTEQRFAWLGGVPRASDLGDGVARGRGDELSDEYDASEAFSKSSLRGAPADD